MDGAYRRPGRRAPRRRRQRRRLGSGLVDSLGHRSGSGVAPEVRGGPIRGHGHVRMSSVPHHQPDEHLPGYRGEPWPVAGSDGHRRSDLQGQGRLRGDGRGPVGVETKGHVETGRTGGFGRRPTLPRTWSRRRLLVPESSPGHRRVVPGIVQVGSRRPAHRDWSLNGRRPDHRRLGPVPSP